MKKRIVLFLMILVSISMLVSSFARAQEGDVNAFCSTANQQGVPELDRMIMENTVNLSNSKNGRERAQLKLIIAEELKERNELAKALDANCP